MEVFGGVVFFREGVDFLEGDGAVVLVAGAGEFEFFRVGLGLGEDGGEPVGVVAECFLKVGEGGGEGAVEFVLRGSFFGQLLGDRFHGGEQQRDVVGLADGLADEVAHAFESIRSAHGGVGRVGGAEFFADLLAEAVAVDFGKDVQAAHLGDVAAHAVGFPDGGGGGLRDLGFVGEGFIRRRFGEIDLT